MTARFEARPLLLHEDALRNGHFPPQRISNRRVKSELKRVQTRYTFPKVTLAPPNTHGYLLLAAIVDRRLPFMYWWESRRKQSLLAAVEIDAEQLRREEGIRDVAVFKAIVMPPVRGRFLRQRPQVPIARFDVLVLVETDGVAQAERVRLHPAWSRIKETVRDSGTQTLIFEARNARSMGAVDRSRNGIFLFNFFYADDVEQNLAVWEYTAGYFQYETGLNNSTLLLPATPVPYTVVNHARWDRLSDILPTLLFKPSFRKYVLAHFEANNTAPMPILYRLALPAQKAR